MKVCGFTFIKDAIKYDYPVVESIRSILPICDEFVVAVGKSSDETLALIQEIDPEKIKIIETVWDESLREGGRVLAVETDKAYQAIPEDTDWCFYIQGDEVVHEKFLPVIQQGMEDHLKNKKVDGLLFNYLHFYGSYDYVAVSSSWYQHEIRIIRKSDHIFSYKDAQGFRKNKDEKLNVKPINAWMYHYGWVKEPKAMQKKQENFNKYWHDDQWVEERVAKAEEFDYSGIDLLSRFEESHPEIMKERIARKNWEFDYDLSKNNLTLKERGKRFLKSIGWDTSHGNYKIV